MFAAHVVNYNGRPVSAFLDQGIAQAKAGDLSGAFVTVEYLSTQQARRDFICKFTPSISVFTQEAA